MLLPVLLTAPVESRAAERIILLPLSLLIILTILLLIVCLVEILVGIILVISLPSVVIVILLVGSTATPELRVVLVKIIFAFEATIEKVILGVSTLPTTFRTRGTLIIRLLGL